MKARCMATHSRSTDKLGADWDDLYGANRYAMHAGVDSATPISWTRKMAKF